LGLCRVGGGTTHAGVIVRPIEQPYAAAVGTPERSSAASSATPRNCAA
jgi:hypothetical protein